MTSIKIFNPKDKPFGVLSNNFEQTLVFTDDSKRYKSVTNYIYANLVQNPTNQVLLANTPVKSVYKLYEDIVYNNELPDKIYKIIETAIDNKLDQDEESRKILLNTGNATIKYIDNNAILGMGQEDKGLNLVGKIYQQKRAQMIRSTNIHKKDIKEQTSQIKIFEAYLAYKYLEYLIKTQKNNLSSYVNKTNDEIVKELKTISSSPLIQTFGSFSDILPNIKEKILPVSNPQINNAIFDSIEHDRQLAQVCRRENLANLRIELEEDRDNIILTLYFEHILEIQAEKLGIKGQIANLVSSTIEGFKKKPKVQQFQELDKLNQMIKMREEGKTNINTIVSDSVLDKMILNINKLKIPTDEEIEHVRSYKFVKPLILENITEDYGYQPSSGEEIMIYNELESNTDPSLKCLSLLYPFIFVVGNLSYPTICHFLYTMLILLLKIPNYNINKIYNDYVISKSKTGNVYTLCQRIILAYKDLKNDQLIKRKQFLLSKALHKKFENRILEDILLATGNKNIIYTDYKDEILGLGNDKTKSQNLTGFMLTQIRKSIKEKRRGETYDIFTEDHIEFLFKDKFFNSWINMRLADTCRVIKIIRTYLYLKNTSKSEQQPELNAEFVKNVIFYIYQPCNLIFSTSDKVKIDVPEIFIEMIHSLPGFKNADLEICNAIWKHMAIMLVILIQTIEDSSKQNLVKVLSKIQYLTSTSKTCPSLSGELNNNLENCTLIALINVLKGIKNFNNLYLYKKEINDLEIEAAISIIIGHDYFSNSEIKRELEKLVEDDEEDEYIETEKSDEGPILLLHPQDDTKDTFEDEEDDIIEDYVEILDNRNFNSDIKFGTPTLRSILEEQLNIDEDNFISIKNKLFAAVNFIIGNTDISKLVKQNRINFFSNLNT
tara:strand:+ start:14687 stop:17356 length:2670 start_codon:yes stop_codon:yes gene_type:complete